MANMITLYQITSTIQYDILFEGEQRINIVRWLLS